MIKESVLRLLDANANRALEGIRVCEEIARFHLRSPRVFRRLRTLRHAIAEGTRNLPIAPAQLVRSRNSAQDLGRRAPSGRVASLERLLLINFQRAKEALRTLEESARLIAPRQSRTFQRLRFRTYEVERDALLRLQAVRHP